MHIAQIRIRNFRCFRDTTVKFDPGLNVITGENNAGKTALMTALRLVLDRGAVSLSVHDMHFEALQEGVPPRIEVTLTLVSDPGDTPEDRAVVASWLTRDGKDWQAQLSFVYELPDEFHADYQSVLGSAPGLPVQKAQHAVEVMQEQRRFVTRYFGGALENRFPAEPEWMTHFQARYLDAIRDAERDLHSGRATLLRQMLQRVLDTKDTDDTQRKHREEFIQLADSVMGNVKGRLDETHLFDFAVRTWSKVAGAPKLGSRLTERDLLAAVVLLLDKQLYEHPVSHGGLGYNNLLYVALVLASMRPVDGERAATSEAAFNALLIEEPEAHLHPALQYRFLSFLKRQLEEDVKTKRRGSRQLFLTSHSTQVTAAVGLDALRCLYLDKKGQPAVAYPGKAFGPKQQNSKAYVERFLDATKSALLFAKAVLFVEGIAEQLLIPRLADFVLGENEEPALLDRNYVAVVRVDGVTFQHFLPLFGLGAASNPEAGLQSHRVALLIDCDPSVACSNTGELLAGQREVDEDLDDDDQSVAYANQQGAHLAGQQEVGEGVNKKASTSGITATTGPAKRRQLCWPYQDGAQPSAIARRLMDHGKRHKERLWVGTATKTFEYDLAYENPDARILVTSVGKKRMRHQIQALFERAQTGQEAHWKSWRPRDTEALDAYRRSADNNELVRRATVATYYFRFIEDTKGEHASELAGVLSQELEKPLAERTQLRIPIYIKDALRWVCEHEVPAAWNQ